MAPLAIGLNAIPIFVLVAIFNNMYPVTSEVPRRLMVTLVVYFIVLVNVARGLREVGAIQLELMRSYAASEAAVLRKVRIPNAVPYLFTALKIAAPASVITAFVSEYFGGSQNGLGSRIVSNIALSNNAEAWAYVLGACLLGLAVLPRRGRPRAGRRPGRGRRGRAGWGMMAHLERRTPGKARPPGGGARMRTKRRIFAAGVLALTLVAAACGDDEGEAAAVAEAAATATRSTRSASSCSGSSRPSSPATSRRRTRASTRTSASRSTLVEGGVDIVPQQPLADGAVDFAVAWVPKALATRRGGGGHRGHRPGVPALGDAPGVVRGLGHHRPEDFAGKTVGNWGFGNEYEVFAALGQAGLDPATDVTLVQQDFNMDGLLSGDIDAAEAMIYNEYAQVLEAVNPDTGELYQPEDLSVISYEEVGVGMLQDAIWADGERLANDEAYRDIAVRLVTASLQGWAYCRDNVQECTRPRRRAGLAARREPPALADERDQPADLAGRPGRRVHRPGGVGPHRRDRRGETPNLEGRPSSRRRRTPRRSRTTS